MKISVLFRSLLIIGIISLSIAAMAENTPENLLRRYVDALKDQSSLPLDLFWTAGDIARSYNLGISFEGINVKIDCASPLVFKAKYIKDNSCRTNIRIEQIDSIAAKGYIDIICPGGDSLAVPYQMIKENGRWFLCSSLYLYSKSWDEIESKYYRIIYTDSSLINDYAIQALDSFTDSLIQAFNIAPERVAHLRKHKIEYYLCSASEIVQLTGYDAHGMVSFPYDAIITRHLPHPHEVTHLMVNYTLEDVPLFTLPVLQEGIACCSGGRWGKSPEVINYWGAAIENLDMIALDSFLTLRGFQTCPVGLDAAYAIGSILTETLLKLDDIDKYLELYTELSGDQEYISSLTIKQVKAKFEKIYGLSWDEISLRYDSTARQKLSCGIAIGHQEDNTTKQIKIKGSMFDVSIDPASSFYHFKIILPSTEAKGIILFADSTLALNENYRSWLLAEHNDDIEHGNIRYGLCFDTGEIGLYDYITNTLVAKYVYGFTPYKDFWDDSTRTMAFSLERGLFENAIDEYEISIVERE